MNASSRNTLLMFISLLKISFLRLMPNAILFEKSRVSFANGFDPFNEKLYNVRVSEGKWLKKESLALEKFTLPSMCRFVHCFIFSETSVGNK